MESMPNMQVTSISTRLSSVLTSEVTCKHFLFFKETKMWNAFRPPMATSLIEHLSKDLTKLILTLKYGAHKLTCQKLQAVENLNFTGTFLC